LRICEPLIATLVLLIVLLTYQQVLPEPFLPVPHPPTGAAVRQLTPTQVLAIEFTASPLEPTPTKTAMATHPSTVAPSVSPTSTVAQPTYTSSPEIQSTATLSPGKEATPVQELSPTPAETNVPAPSPTLTDEPTATPEASRWNLAQDIIGLWEQVDQDWQYYFDFLEDGIVIVAENGARTYAIEGDRTIVIQMPGDPWMLTVRDLSEDTLILEGVFGPRDEFYRENGVPDLDQAMVGLWTDTSDEVSPIEFTPGGIALGEFGRGTYQVVSNSHVFIECDDPAQCAPYREYAQPEDAPLSLRVYEIAENRITVLGFGYAEKWALDRFEGHPTLAADIVGLWEDEFGSTLQFTTAGGLVQDGGTPGSYEVLSETTLWITLDSSEAAWVIAELDADTMSYTELGIDWEEPWAYSRVE